MYRIQPAARLHDPRLAVSLLLRPDHHFTHPADFDLAAFWADWRQARAADRHGYWVTVRVAPTSMSRLRARLGRVADLSPTATDRDDRRTVKLTFASLEDARDRLLGFGRGVEVIAPHALRCSIADYAQQIAALYTA